jgi:hypothetical protein
MALIVDHCNAVQGECPPPRCRADSLSPEVATDQHGSTRGYMGGTRKPTGNPPEQSDPGIGTRIHG